MPMYEYHCEACGHTFEKLRRLQERDQALKCPKCHSSKVQQVLSSFHAGGCGRSGKFG